MERIPVPDVSEGDRPEVTKIVDGMPTLEANRADADMLESATEEMVCDLCCLTRRQEEVVPQGGDASVSAD